jgi:hypothetical protein
MIETWILWSWLCTGPGRTGECAPLPDKRVEGRGLCLRQAKAIRQAFPEVTAHCKRAERQGPPPPESGQ